ncbi:YlxR family protein [Filobacillus milosensis]|uniref:YlxR family protein n=1 Tax=Filobacillus milosensis TaxID=94137 RepID=A0A4Y8INL0_9BACI|nr:YlxR family protein [Filobacillus milosensis]TFB23173.1 YlxR family protein [Filobacillus milosensis]
MTVAKKEPLRKCVVTQEMFPKKDLIRIVRNKDGETFIDDSGKMNGRGAYLSRSKEVVEKAKKSNILQRHLNTSIDSSLYDDLMEKVGE